MERNKKDLFSDGKGVEPPKTFPQVPNLSEASPEEMKAQTQGHLAHVGT